MNKEHYVVGVLVEESKTYSFVELCHQYPIPKDMLVELIEQGLLSKTPEHIEDLLLNQTEVRRIQAAFRLHQDLGINMAGVTLAMELLDEMEKMQQELDILRRHF